LAHSPSSHVSLFLARSIAFTNAITGFADRQFYADWWNSCDWLEFSREWNKPVHHFFRRHVYSASKNHMSRPLATTITFLVSALAHELVMGCITRKFRGYGFFAMMLQMPIVMVQRSKWVRGRTLLNNVLFWCSMILGLSMVSQAIGSVYEPVLTDARCVLYMCWYKLEIRSIACKVFLGWRCDFARYPSVWLYLHRS
jgi:hypothetical protein